MHDPRGAAGARQDARRTSRKITIRTHEACIRIIDKKGPLDNPADRDHCIQYMVAVPILFGRLTAARLRGRGRRRSAHRRAARQDRLRRGQAVHPGLPRPGEALDRQRAHGGVQGRQEAEGDRGRVPDRPQAPPQGGHAGAGGEVPDQPRAPLPGEAAEGDPRRCAWTQKTLEAMPVNEFVDLMVHLKSHRCGLDRSDAARIARGAWRARRFQSDAARHVGVHAGSRRTWRAEPDRPLLHRRQPISRTRRSPASTVSCSAR